MNKTTLENWEERFNKKFKHHYECNLENDSASDVVCNCELIEVKQFIKDLLASSQKDKEKAVEENTQEIFRIISEELSIAYPDPHRGFRDMIEAEVDELCSAISKSLKSKKE